MIPAAGSRADVLAALPVPAGPPDVLVESDVVPVDVVVVAYGNHDDIGWTLARARRLGGRTVVVDHGDGQAAAYAARMGAVTVHDPANPGFGAGQNRGVSLTGTEYVLLCNPDARILPLAVMEGARYLRDHPGVAMVQGVIRDREGAMERSQGRELGPLHLLGRATGARRLLKFEPVRRAAARSTRLRDHAERRPDGPVHVESLAATAVLVRRSAFDSIGGFDSRYFLYGEDLDLCRRLRDGGWELAALPIEWAVHGGGKSSPSAWDRELRWWEGTRVFAARWWNVPAQVVGWTAAVAVCARLAACRPRSARAAARALLKVHPGPHGI